MKKQFNFEIDVHKKTIPTSRSWQFGIGNDHAFQIMRTDVCEHLKLAHDELGFRYVRFHGLFDDDMRIIQTFDALKKYNVAEAEKIREINFRRVAVVLDNVLKCGLKPFIELSFMPKALAGGNTTGMAYAANITMPENLTEWQEFIKAFLSFAISRYGREEVINWYFEVWNEPDLAIFFDGTKEDYFSLYAATVKAVKDVDERLRVGGPATSACRWLRDFTKFCEDNSLLYDFVSTHHYPGDAFGNILSDRPANRILDTAAEAIRTGKDLSDTMTDIFFDPSVYRQWKKGAFIGMDNAARTIVGDRPLFISEWNSMATFTAPVHDEKYSAAFVIKSVMDARNIAEGYMFWCCSDVFEEIYDLGKPFHGSFGIVSSDGIPKPNFWAFKILSELYANRIESPVTNADVEYAVFTDGEKAQVLVYAQDFDYDKDEKYQVELVLNAEYSSVTSQIIDDLHCNPKAEWEKLGKPAHLTAEQVKKIKAKTKLREGKKKFVTEDGKTKIGFTLHSNDVVLFQLK